jgi:hypothetical protein
MNTISKLNTIVLNVRCLSLIIELIHKCIEASHANTSIKQPLFAEKLKQMQESTSEWELPRLNRTHCSNSQHTAVFVYIFNDTAMYNISLQVVDCVFIVNKFLLQTVTCYCSLRGYRLFVVDDKTAQVNNCKQNHVRTGTQYSCQQINNFSKIL